MSDANCMVKAEAADSGCLHVNVEEKWRAQLSQIFMFFFITSYHSCKLIKYKWITYLRNILYHTKKRSFLKQNPVGVVIQLIHKVKSNGLKALHSFVL